MNTYRYRAKKGHLETVEGKMAAVSQEEAVDRLTAQGLVPVSVRLEERDTAVFQKSRNTTDTPFRSVRLRTRDIDFFTRQMASLIKGGVPILKSFALISQNSKSKALSAIAADIEKQIGDGRTFSDALLRYPKVFNALYVNLVRSGEKSGALAEILTDLADYREKEHETRQKIQSALAYPGFMFCVGLMTIFFMLTFFLPKLTVFFTDSHQRLPLPTRILLSVSGFLSVAWPWLVAGVLLAGLYLYRSRESLGLRRFFSVWALRIPVIKDLISGTEMARFFRTLSLLLGNGISICEAIGLASEILSNEVLKDAFQKTRSDILAQGTSFSESLRGQKPVPSFVSTMVSVGEESGRLDGSLREISEIYTKETDQTIKVMSSLMEPIMILGIGSIVGFIVMAMLLPIFEIGLTVR